MYKLFKNILYVIDILFLMYRKILMKILNNNIFVSIRNPQLPVFHDNDLTYYPDNIVNAYLKTISSFGNGIEYRATRRSQEFGRLLRMNDRNSRWDFHQGLFTLITALLQLNMIGYPFVLPDMIGGNGYFNSPPSKGYSVKSSGLVDRPNGSGCTSNRQR